MFPNARPPCPRSEQIEGDGEGRHAKSFPDFDPAQGLPLRRCLLFAFRCPEGLCGTTGRIAAPAAPAFACERPYAVSQSTHGLPHAASQAAYGPGPNPFPGRAHHGSSIRLRSAHDGFCGLLPVPGFVATADAPRSCELSPGPALGPSARVAGVCAPCAFKDRNPRRRLEPGIVADHRIPLPRHEHARGAPLNGAGRGQKYS